MLAQPQIDALVLHLDGAFSPHAAALGLSPSLELLVEQLARAAELAAHDAAVIAPAGDPVYEVAELERAAAVFAEAHTGARVHALSDASDALDKALAEWAHTLGQVHAELDPHLQAHHAALQEKVHEGLKVIEQAAVEFHAASVRCQDDTVAPKLAEANAEATKIAEERVAAVHELLERTAHRLAAEAASAAAVLERATESIGHGLGGLDQAARGMLDTAVQHLLSQVEAAIVGQVLAIVGRDLESAGVSILAGEGLSALVAATGPWVGAIHLAKEAMERL